MLIIKGAKIAKFGGAFFGVTGLVVDGKKFGENLFSDTPLSVQTLRYGLLTTSDMVGLFVPGIGRVVPLAAKCIDILIEESGGYDDAKSSIE